MAGRRSVWNDPRVIEKVLSFTPATDEVWRLQRHPDKECQFFRQQVAGRTTPIGGSWQGLYVFSPSGKLLVRQNTLQADKALILLEKGLAAWEALPAEERLPIDPFIYEPAHRWELFYPSDGLVLRSTSRDLPEKGLRSETRGRWNRDHIWFHHSELKEWIPTSLKSGQVHSLPAGLAMRLARFHIVDNVSGQEGPFSPEDIEKAEVTITVGDREADKVTLLLSGEFRSRCVRKSVGWKWTEWSPRYHRSQTRQSRMVSGDDGGFALVKVGTGIRRRLWRRLDQTTHSIKRQLV